MTEQLPQFPVDELIELGILSTKAGYLGPGQNAEAIMTLLISMNCPIPHFQTVLDFRNAQTADGNYPADGPPAMVDESDITPPDTFGGLDV